MNKLTLWLMVGAGVIFAGLVYLGRKTTTSADGTSSNALKDFLGSTGGGSSSTSSQAAAATPTPLEKAKSVAWAGLGWFWQDAATGSTNSGTMDGDIDANLRAGWQLADVRDIGNDGTLDLVWYKGTERSIWTQKKP